MLNKRLINTGEAIPTPPAFDPLQNFETVTYTGNGSTQKITGYIRKGAAFNGSSSLIDLGGSAPFGDRDDIKSISGWVKANSTSNVWLYSVSGTADSVDWFYVAYRPANNGIFVYRRLDTSNYASTSATITPDNNWHHIVAQVTATEVEIYLDGTKLTTTNTNAGSGSNTSWISYGAYGGTIKSMIGKSRQNTPGYTDGYIDQVRIFNRALLEDNNGVDEIQALADETYADPKKSTTDYFGDGSGIALYELDEDANSSNFEQAASFNGSSSIITTSLDFGTLTNYSVSMWLNPSQANGNFFGGTINSSTLNGIYFSVNTDSTIRYYERDASSSATQINSTDTITLNSWNHIVFVRNGNTNYIYVNNGTPDSASNSTITHSTGFTLGRGGAYSSSNYYNGKIDQVRIYSSALDSTDVEKLYEESADVPTSTLVAHYKLDGDATDETENYDGTETSITYSTGVYGGTPTNVNFLGMAFQPDFVWVKSRAAGSHIVTDSVRGNGKELYPDLTNQEGIVNRFSLTSNGFDVTTSGYGNAIGVNYVAWCWKAADTTTTISAGTVGNDDASNVRANQDAGFSIVEWSSSGGARTVAHGLNSAPELIIIKKTTTTSPWSVYVSAVGNNKRLQLNESAAAALDNIWGNTDPTNQVFTQQISASATTDNIAYCFHSVDGYQKVGSYTGDGSTSGNIITTGFKPRFLLTKPAGPTGGYWYIIDNTRNPSNPRNSALFPNDSLAEITNSNYNVDFLSNGFELKNNQIGFNTSGETYIYLAIA